MILVAVFFAARIIPPDAEILGLFLAIVLIATFIDFYLEITTKRGLFDHLSNQ